MLSARVAIMRKSSNVDSQTTGAANGGTALVVHSNRSLQIWSGSRAISTRRLRVARQHRDLSEGPGMQAASTLVTELPHPEVCKLENPLLRVPERSAVTSSRPGAQWCLGNSALGRLVLWAGSRLERAAHVAVAMLRRPDT